jgi:hypothetical protein
MLTALWIVRGLFVLIPLTVLVDLGEVWSRGVGARIAIVETTRSPDPRNAWGG